MNIKQSEYANTDQQAETGAGPASAGVLTLSASELASLLCACGLLPDQAQQRRNRDDGGPA